MARILAFLCLASALVAASVVDSQAITSRPVLSTDGVRSSCDGSWSTGTWAPDSPSIVVLNPKSTPVVGGSWEVNFLLRGKADLRVDAVAPTVLSGGDILGTDVVLRWVELGGERQVADIVDGVVQLPQSASEGICTLSVRVLTEGRHRLRLKFGESEAIADNSALATFTSITTAVSGLNTDTGNSMTFADLNGDGYPDMAKSDDAGAAGDLVRVLTNDKDGTFTLVTGISTLSYRGIAAGDQDNDGDTDLVATVNTSSLIPRVLSNSNGLGTVYTTTNPSSNNCEAVNWIDIDGDGDLDIWSPGELQMWHRNDGSSTFVAQNLVPGTTSVLTNGEGSTAADWTNDGRIDLLYNTGSGGSTVCHAYVPNASFSYTRHTNVNTSFGLPQDVGDHEGMEWAWGDFDNDGDVDVFISGDTSVGLYRNNGAGLFSSVGAGLGVTITATTKGASWGDYDNDGDLDLLVAKDTNSVLYRNSGSPSYTFTAVTSLAGISTVTSVAGFCDFDLDGDLDIMSLTGQFFRNNLSGNAQTDYLKVRAFGGGSSGFSPRTPIGARIRVYDSTGTTLLATQWVSASQNNFQPYGVAHFGLDSGTEYRIKVLFPSSQREITVTNVVPRHTNSTQGTTALAQTLTVFETSDQLTYSNCGAGGTIVFYGVGVTSSTVKRRDYALTTNTVGSETDAIGAIARELRWVSAENASNGNTVVIQTEYGGANQVYFTARRYTGSTWVTDWTVGPLADRYGRCRSAHIAKEKVSGDLLVVYSIGTSATQYRTFDGTTWSAAANVFTTPPGGICEWPKLIPHPATDEMWLFQSDDARDLYGIRWSGSAWVQATKQLLENNLQSNGTDNTVDLPVFDVAYEYQSYDMLACWGPATGGFTAKYSTKPSASDTFAAATGYDPIAGGGIRFHTSALSSDKSSNNIALACMNTTTIGPKDEQLGGGIWNGSAWTFLQQIDAAARDLQDGARSRFRQIIVMEWVNNGAVIVYPDTNTGVVDWIRWTAAGGWVTKTDYAPTSMAAGDVTESVLWWSDTITQKLGCLISDSSRKLHLLSNDGNQWSETLPSSVMTTDLSTITNGTPFAVLKLQAGTGTAGLWVGEESDDWNDPHNWDDCSVPSSEAVTIPAGTTYSPVITRSGGSVTTISVAAGASLTIAGGGSLTATGTISVSGTLQVDGGASLTMGNGTSIAVASGGSLLARGSDGSDAAGAASITTATPATQAFTITAASGSTVDLKGAAITAGRIIASNNIVLRVSATVFATLPAATTSFIDLTAVTSSTLNFRNLTFTRGSLVTAALARNIAVTASTPIITVFGYSGNLAGETYDSDPANVVLWQNNCFGLLISGNTYWQYRRPIRIDHTKVGRGGLTNYPVFVTITDLDMVGKAQGDGDDFRFLSSAGVQLDHEIETWNTATGELSAWVEIPSLSDRVDTILELQYGNPLATNQQNASGVWDANYLAVWHLDDASAGTADDSTSNNRNGTGVALNAATGPFSGASNWVASGGGVFPRVQHSTSAFPISNCSYEVWVRTNTTATEAALVSYTSSARDNEFLLFNHRNLAPYVRSNNTTTGISVNNGAWRHLAMTWSNVDGYVRVYVDGAAVYATSFASGQTLSAVGGLVLGQEQDSVLGGYAANQALIGDMDEFRWSNTVRSESWIQTQYNNGVNPATFAIVSPEENVSPNMLDIADYLPGVGETLTVTGAATDASNRAVNSHSDHRGVMTLPAFLGTLNIDGIRFTPAGSTSGVSVALGATGTVNFYNCAFIDPGNGMSTSTAGAGRAVITSSGATRNADFCTIDSTNAATAGLTTVTNSIFTADLTTGVGGTRALHCIDFDNRDLRPTYAMLSSGSYSATRNATWTKDLDGRTRSTPTVRGAWENRSTSAMTIANSDITNGLGTGTLVSFNTIPVNNSVGNAIYLSGSDGTNCYLSVLNRTTLAVAHVAQWAGAKTGTTSFLATTDLPTTNFWVYVPYDSDADGSYDRVRRLHHVKDTSLTNSGDLTMLSRTGTAIDLASNGGWNGILSMQNAYTTGVTSNEHQVSIASPAGNGSIHSWYVNKASTSGTFWNTADFSGTEGRASDSYYGSGGFAFSPNVYAQPLVQGSVASGSIALTRTVDATNTASIVVLSRNGTGTVTVNNSYTGGTDIGDSVTGVPFFLFGVSGKMAIQRNDQAGSILLQWPNLTAETLVITSPTGLVGATAVPQVAFNQNVGVSFVPLQADTGGCFGGVAAVEYTSTQDGVAAFSLLGSSYAQTNKQYHDDTGTPGSFSNGVAQTVGNVTRLAFSPSPVTNTVIFAGTDAGLLYCWEAHSNLTTSTVKKGQLITGFPIRIEAGRITAINFVTITDTALRARVNLAAGSSNILAVFTDRGQVVLVRTPEIP